MMEAEGWSENSNKEKEWKVLSSVLRTLELLDDRISSEKRKKRKEEEEEMEQYYNVSVYRVLPYPPHTKDEKDFFVQRN